MFPRWITIKGILIFFLENITEKSFQIQYSYILIFDDKRFLFSQDLKKNKKKIVEEIFCNEAKVFAMSYLDPVLHVGPLLPSIDVASLKILCKTFLSCDDIYVVSTPPLQTHFRKD